MKVVIPVDSPENVEILVGLPDGRLLCVLIVDVIDNNLEAYVCVETSKWKSGTVTIPLSDSNLKFAR